MTKSNQTPESKTAIIRDLTFYWANVYKTHNPFGAEIWDLQIRTEDKDKIKELAELGIKLKEHADGYFFGNVKRKTTNSKGEPMTGPQVLDAGKAPMTDPIGNGSKGNIKVFSYPYKVGPNKGITAMLTAVQVVDLVPYEANNEVDFEVETDDEPF